MIRSGLMFAAAILLFVAACSEPTGLPEKTSLPNAVQQDTMVEWLQPPAGELPRRSEDEKQRGMQVGRELPRPELLQPSLDPTLQPFVAKLDPNVSASFIGGASDTLPGLVQSWIRAFNEYYPNAKFEIGTPYAGSLGMLEVIDGNYDFVFVSRELKPTDISSFNEKYGYPPLSVPISGGSYRHYGFLDAIGFFVHVDNPLDRLSFDEIDRLYSSTQHRGGTPIATWGDLGLTGEWAERQVNLYSVAPWNGFEEFVRQRALSVDRGRGEWRDDVVFSDKAFSVSGNVADDPLGIGYTGLAYIAEGVKMLPLSDSGEGGTYVEPSYERVADATYPLSRLIYFNTNRRPGDPMNPVLEELLRFILSREGQQLILDQAIYLPLRSSQTNASLALVEQGGKP